MMKIAFFTDSLTTFIVYKDSTFAMMHEAVRRGHIIYVFEQGDIVLEGGFVMAQTIKIILTGDEKKWYRTEKTKLAFLCEFDVIIIRKDPPLNMEYMYSTYLLELATKQGARIFNQPEAIRNYNEKLAIAQFPQFIVPTLVTRNIKRLRAFHTEHKNVIFKPLHGMGGMGVFFVGQDGINLGSIIEMLTKSGKSTIMAQRFIPAISLGDKRILLIGGKVMPYVLARIPQNGEMRGNLAAGGFGVAQKILPSERKIAETLAPVLMQKGLFLVGLDIIGEYLTEINVTSPTCFQEIMQQTGFNAVAIFFDEIEMMITC